MKAERRGVEAFAHLDTGAPAPVKVRRHTRGVLVVAAIVVAACDVAPALQPANVAGLSDDFNGAELDRSWRKFKPETYTLGLDQGEVSMMPNRNVVWWKKDSGPGLFKPVQGNFKVTASVKARSAKEPAEPVRNGYQFAGLILRNPGAAASGAENYVFNVVGFRGDYLSVETKSTRNGASAVEGPPWPAGDAELRICRVNDEFLLFHRAAGAPVWEESISYRRSDLPPELEVGPIAYTYTDEWDLRASFDYVRFEAVTSDEQCARD